jgi:lysophospholipase L1-like esterase
VKIVSFTGQCAFVAVIGLSSLQSTQAAKRDASRVITILALGDSLTAGYGLYRTQAYPALIAEKMRSANYQFEVINAGSSGDSTAGGLCRLPPLLRKKIDILILALGINDAFRGVSIEQMRSICRRSSIKRGPGTPAFQSSSVECICRSLRATRTWTRSEKCLEHWQKKITRR